MVNAMGLNIIVGLIVIMMPCVVFGLVMISSPCLIVYLVYAFKRAIRNNVAIGDRVQLLDVEPYDPKNHCGSHQCAICWVEYDESSQIITLPCNA